MREHAARSDRPHWDKGQMVIDTGDGRVNEPIGTDAMEEGESALSGHLANPGGGYGYAEVDRSA